MRCRVVGYPREVVSQQLSSEKDEQQRNAVDMSQAHPKQHGHWLIVNRVHEERMTYIESVPWRSMSRVS